MPLCTKKVNPMQQNSNCQVEFTYAHGRVQVLAQLVGPTEAKMASKQDSSKCFVEVYLKLTSATQHLKIDLQASLRQNLE